MIIDVHVHYGHRERQDTDYVSELTETCRRLGIARAAVMGIGPEVRRVMEPGASAPAEVRRWGDVNDKVLALSRSHGDFAIPVAYFRLDYDSPAKIDDLAFQGFRGLKFLWPHENYDSEKYFHVYDKAAAHGLVMNFHTGLINGAPRERKFGVTSARMRVQHVEAVARTFSSARVLVSHFGFPEYEAAGALARILPNLHLDISPSGPPTAPPDLMRHDLKERKLIGRHIPVEKMLFGSDCYLENLEAQIAGWGTLFDEIGLGKEDQDRIWHKNASDIYWS